MDTTKMTAAELANEIQRLVLNAQRKGKNEVLENEKVKLGLQFALMELVQAETLHQE